MTRKKNDTHRGTGRKLFPLKEEDSGMFKKIKKYQQEYEEQLAKDAIKEYRKKHG